MSETFLGSANFVENLIRTIFSTLDRPAYWLLEIVYQLFFNVASADIFASGMVMKFYGRIQMILSVFMMFQLALIILKGIMNPDSFYDKKAGVSNFVTRVIVALILLTLMVPIKAGNNNEFNRQISSNGVLFGTLYSLQHRILANNVIGKLVMGTSSTDYMSDSSDMDDLKKASRIFTSTVLRGFYRINLLPEADRPRHENGKDDAVFNDNRVCQDIDDKILDTYTQIDAEPGNIIDLIHETCEPDFNLFNHIPILSSTSGTKKYAFTFMPIISTIVGFLFVFILLSFTVDIAVRAVKLAVLRLIAPIPIIAYMNPKGSTDTAFNSWVKSLVSTYLDLFIRLASVYFVIAIIQEMIAHGIYINHGDGIIGILSLILIWIGLFIFAKQAPKFIKDVLGLKEGPGKLFGGLGELMGLGAATLGTIGSARTNYRAAKEENEALHPGSRINFLRNSGSALAGAIGGGYVGAKAWAGNDASAKSVLAAQSQRNARRAAHSTLPGRVMDSAYGMVTGESLAARGNRILESNKEAFSALKKWKDSVKAEAAKNGGSFDYTLSNGQVLRNITYDQILAMKEAGANDDGCFVLNGNRYEASLFGTNTMEEIADQQVLAWKNGSRRRLANGEYAKSWDEVINGKLAPDHQRTIKAVRDANISVDIDDYEALGEAMRQANTNQQEQETNMEQIMRRANNQQRQQ